MKYASKCQRMMLEMIPALGIAPAHISSTQALNLTPPDGRDSSKSSPKDGFHRNPLRISLGIYYATEAVVADILVRYS